jgi:ubiquinone/menaquinone biosynthesis C-methylase UbiE
MSTTVEDPEQTPKQAEGHNHAETERIRAVYARRRQNIPPDRYALLNPFVLCSTHEREDAMAALFRRAHLHSLEGLRVLDVGCGRGELLRRFLSFGGSPSLLFGIDLLPEHVDAARKLAPHFEITCGSADWLPFPDAHFDLVTQFTLLTSVLDNGIRQAIADEMARVLKPGGKLLWYDFSFNNPRNPDVRGIGKAEVRRLFPGFSMDGRRITLAPPLGRTIAPRSRLLYYLLANIKPLCTHYICLMEKKCGGNT